MATGGAGYGNLDVEQLFRWDSRAWSLGPSVTLRIFQGRRNRANLARSRAACDEALAAYRQSVLVAFRKLPDALTAQRLLAIRTAAQLSGARLVTAVALVKALGGGWEPAQP